MRQGWVRRVQRTEWDDIRLSVCANRLSNCPHLIGKTCCCRDTNYLSCPGARTVCSPKSTFVAHSRRQSAVVSQSNDSCVYVFTKHGKYVYIYVYFYYIHRFSSTEQVCEQKSLTIMTSLHGRHCMCVCVCVCMTMSRDLQSNCEISLIRMSTLHTQTRTDFKTNSLS